MQSTIAMLWVNTITRLCLHYYYTLGQYYNYTLTTQLL